MQTTLRRTPLLALVAALLALAASPAGAASDKALAAQGVIVAKDVPSSWSSEPADDSGDKELEREAAKIPECRTYLAVRKANKKAANAESRTFSDGSNELSNEVWVYPSVAKAKKVFKDMSSSTIAECFSTLFEDVFGADSASIRQTIGIEGLAGDETLAYSGPVQVTNPDGTVDRLLLANFGVRAGRSILSFTVAGPPDAQGNYASTFVGPAEDAINDAVKRMQSALG